jgi:hypothetical protein
MCSSRTKISKPGKDNVFLHYCIGNARAIIIPGQRMKKTEIISFVLGNHQKVFIKIRKKTRELRPTKVGPLASP